MVDDIEEASAGATPDQGARYGNGEVGLAGSGVADLHDVALVGEEDAGAEVAHETFEDTLQNADADMT